MLQNWTGLIPKSIKDSREYENITVLLHAYFATLPMRENFMKIDHIIDANSDQKEKENVIEFTEVSTNKTYLESTEFKNVESLGDVKILELDESRVQTENKGSDKENVSTEFKLEEEGEKISVKEEEIVSRDVDNVEKKKEIEINNEGNDNKTKKDNVEEKTGTKEKKLENLVNEEIKINNFIMNADENNIIKREELENIVEEEVLNEEGIESLEKDKMKTFDKIIDDDEKEEKSNHPTAMEMFKNYLLENKYRFSSETEYLPLFALPFIENPKEHQAYSEVFKVLLILFYKYFLILLDIYYILFYTHTIKACKYNFIMKCDFELTKTQTKNII